MTDQPIIRVTARDLELGDEATQDLKAGPVRRDVRRSDPRRPRAAPRERHRRDHPEAEGVVSTNPSRPDLINHANACLNVAYEALGDAADDLRDLMDHEVLRAINEAKDIIGA